MESFKKLDTQTLQMPTHKQPGGGICPAEPDLRTRTWRCAAPRMVSSGLRFSRGSPVRPGGEWGVRNLNIIKERRKVRHWYPGEKLE